MKQAKGHGDQNQQLGARKIPVGGQQNASDRIGNGRGGQRDAGQLKQVSASQGPGESEVLGSVADQAQQIVVSHIDHQGDDQHESHNLGIAQGAGAHR